MIGKHDGTGGEVSIGTVTSQLLYEIGGPRYLGPDVTARFDTIQLEQVAPDRVRIHGMQGEPPPATLKVCMNRAGGFRNDMRRVPRRARRRGEGAAGRGRRSGPPARTRPSDFAQVTTRLAAHRQAGPGDERAGGRRAGTSA